MTPLPRAYEALFKPPYHPKSPQQLQHDVLIGESMLQRGTFTRNAATSIRPRGQDFGFLEAYDSRARTWKDVSRLDEVEAGRDVAAVAPMDVKYDKETLENMECRNTATYQLNKLAEGGCYAV